jgi:predicted enzyme related to lactoylglutathione lyase
MTMPNRVVHFEIPVDDPDRAVEFYEKVFGWKIEKWEGPMDYWLVTTGDDPEPGIDGALSRREDLPATTNTIDVPSADGFMEKIKENGGRVSTGKIVVPGVGYMAYCEDTEGNSFGIMQRDETAK